MARIEWRGGATTALFAICLMGATGALAQTVPGGHSPERLIPEDDQAVQTDGGLRAQGSDDEVVGSLTLRTPLWQEDDWYLMLQGDGYIARDLDADQGYWGGDLGLILRQAIDPNDAWGVNAFVDLGHFDGFGGQGSIGLEYEHLGARGTSYRAGANAYIPFADYSEDRDRARGPRLGGDFYLGVGQDHGWHRLEGFVTAFHYAETDEARALWGVAGEAEYRYSGFDFLPDGSHLYAKLGVRWDTIDDELSPLFGVGITIAFWDDGEHERVAEIRRNIAYGTAFVPFEYKPRTASTPGAQEPDLGCGPGNLPFADAQLRSLLLDDGDLTPNEELPIASFPTVASIVGQPAIDAACSGDANCIAAINALDTADGITNVGVISESVQVRASKPANSCVWTGSFAGGG